MTRGEAVNWLINIMSDIGKIEHQDLWHYEQTLSEIRELLEAQPEVLACGEGELSAQPEPCEDANGIIIRDVEFPKGCVYEGKNGKTEYCFLCNHADVPFCMYIEYESEAAIGIDERPCYCPLEKITVQPERKTGRWIPISEKLPEEDADILVTYVDGEEVRIIPVNYGRGTWFDCILDNALDSLKVTAWMPLPEPWKGDEAE